LGLDNFDELNSVFILLINQFNRCLSSADLSDDWKDLQSVVDEMNGYADFPRPSVEDYLNGMRANVFYDFFYDSWINDESSWLISLLFAISSGKTICNQKIIDHKHTRCRWKYYSEPSIDWKIPFFNWEGQNITLWDRVATSTLIAFFSTI